MALNIIKNGENIAETTPVEMSAPAPAVEVAAEAPKAAAPTNLETMSDKIVLIGPLGDPSRDDVTPRIVNGVEEKITTATIVGYRFKALVDMVVPECGLGDDAKKNIMSYKDVNGTKAVKAGETFDLTRFETGLLLSRPEFNALITGEGQNWSVVYQKTRGVKDADGVATTAGADVLPTVSLRGNDGASIKDMPFIDVLTFSKSTVPASTGDGKVRVVVDRKILPGFEKFEPLCQRAPARTSAGSASTGAPTYKKAAGNFLAMVAKKNKAQA
jgi:hypothetical protein